MAEDNITTKIGIDISQFKRGLQDAQRQIKLANAEFQKASAGMDKWSDSAEGISAKIKQLESVLDAENQKLALQKQRLAEVEKEQGANSAGADELRIAIAKQEASIAKTQKSLEYFNNQLVKVNKSEKESNTELSKLTSTIDQQQNAVNDLKKEYADAVLTYGKNSKEARSLGKDIEKLSSDMVNNRNKVDDATASADKFDKSISDAGDATEDAGKQANEASNGGFTVLKGVMANLASSAITAVVSGLKNVTGELINMGKQAVQAYADYEQLKGGIETMFEDLSVDVMDNANKAFATTGMSANEYMETVMSFSASLNQSLMKTQGNIQCSANIADSIIEDMADNASKMGTSMDSIQNAYAGFAKGQFNMLDNLKLGYGGTKEEMERLLRDAEEIEGYKFGSLDISNFADITEAIHIIQEDMGIAGNASLEASDTISGSLGAMKASFQNLLTGLGSGENLEGLIGNFIDSLVTYLGNVTPIVKNVISGIGTLISSLGSDIIPQLLSVLEPELPGLLDSLLSAITSLFETGVPVLLNLINSELPTILNALTTILLTIVNSLVEELPSIAETLLNSAILVLNTIIDNFPVDQILEVIPKLIDVLMGALPKIMQAGYKLLSGLLAQLPKFLKLLSKELPKIIKSLISFVNSELPTILKLGITLFTELLNAIPVFLQELLPQLPAIIETLVDFLTSNLPLILDASIQLFMAIIEALPIIAKALIPELGNIVVTICSALVDSAPELLASAWEFFSVIITDVIPQLLMALGEVGAEFLDTIIEKFIKPAVEWFSNLWDNLTGIFEDIGGWFKEKFEDAWKKIKEAFGAVGEFFSGVWETIKSPFVEVGRWFYRTFATAWGKIKQVFEPVFVFFSGVFGGIKKAFDGIVGWFEKIFQDAYNGVTWIFEKLGDWFQWIIDKYEYVMDLIYGDSILEKNDLYQKAKQAKQNGSAPTMATGGVLRKGQIGILEGDGAEAVVPLDQNKKWIQATARDMKVALQGEGVVSGRGTVTNYNFVQNNTSPKPLNRLEIYRQTKNQFDLYAMGG